MGVIGCLKAGFEVIGRYLWLITIPVLLDLFLWLGPRVSIAPLLQQLTALLTSQPAPDLATGRQVELTVQFLEQAGERFNLLSLLSTLPILNVPSLLAWRPLEATSPLGHIQVLLNSNALLPFVCGIVLLPIGLVLGFLYLNSLAQKIRTIRPPDGKRGLEAEQAIPLNSNGAKFVRVFVFASGILITGMILLPLWTLFVGIFFVIAPLLGFLGWTLGLGMGSYFALHLLFVVPGVLLGERGLIQATWESILLIHSQFPSVMGLFLLTLVISGGLQFVWSLPSVDSWSLAVGILGNSCVATGLTAAVFFFYQERIEQVIQMRRKSAKA